MERILATVRLMTVEQKAEVIEILWGTVNKKAVPAPAPRSPSPPKHVEHIHKKGPSAAAESMPKSEVVADLLRMAKEGVPDDLSGAPTVVLKRMWCICAWKEYEEHRRNTPGCNSRAEIAGFIRHVVESGALLNIDKARNSHLPKWREEYARLRASYLE